MESLMRSVAEIKKKLSICEEETDRYDGITEELFTALAPFAEMQLAGDELYRAHVVELLGRAERGEVMNTATNAEAIVVLGPAAGRRELNKEGMMIFIVAFRRAFGEEVYLQEFGDIPEAALADEYSSNLDEFLSTTEIPFRKAGYPKITPKVLS